MLRVVNVCGYVCFLLMFVTEKDKNPYTRQRSAPQFRIRGSRLGLSLFTNYMFPGVHCYCNESSGRINAKDWCTLMCRQTNIIRWLQHQISYCLFKLITGKTSTIWQYHTYYVSRHTEMCDWCWWLQQVCCYKQYEQL